MTPFFPLHVPDRTIHTMGHSQPIACFCYLSFELLLWYSCSSSSLLSSSITLTHPLQVVILPATTLFAHLPVVSLSFWHAFQPYTPPPTPNMCCRSSLFINNHEYYLLIFCCLQHNKKVRGMLRRMNSIGPQRHCGPCLPSHFLSSMAHWLQWIYANKNIMNKKGVTISSRHEARPPRSKTQTNKQTQTNMNTNIQESLW